MADNFFFYLAMCKGIMDQAKVEIYFETKALEGTISFVEFLIVCE